MNSSLQEELNRAFRLAYFIHRDKQRALLIAAGALSKLEVTAAAQDKRLYYTPAGRTPADAARAHRPRTKVAMSELHLLQRLVYVESEAYERQEEAAARDACLDEEDMIIRFIKHLVRITTRRNSFYVALGLARLLHQYSTNETAEIYDLVIQDSERFKDDDYYRSRKRRLIQELCERFADLIRLTKSKTGEERFESEDQPRARVPLVSSCLDQFTPWNTACPLPDRPDLGADEIMALRFDGKDPDQEHPVEVRRMHALIHPGCCSRLIAALGFDSTETKLTVPRFFLEASDGGNSRRPGDRTKAPTLTDDELMLVGTELAENARRRKASSARLLAIRVDGTEVATIDLNRESSTVFQVNDGAELVEVITRDSRGELLLASHLLTLEEDGRPAAAAFSIELEGGQKVTFTMSAAGQGVGLTDGLAVEVSYAATSVSRAAALYARRLLGRVSGSLQSGPARSRIMARPALATGLAVVFAVGILLYLRPWRSVAPVQTAKDQSTDEQYGAAGAPTPATAPSPSQSDANSNLKAGASGPSGPIRNANSRANSNRRIGTVPRFLPEAPSIAETQPPDQNREGAPDASPETNLTATRGTPRLAAKKLAAIKHVYIDSLGSGDFADAIRRAIGETLDKSGELNTVSTRDQADAVLKGAATVSAQRSNQGNQTGTVLIKLIAVDGSTLWSWPPSGSAANSSGTPSRLASLISNDLIERVQAARVK